MKKFFWFILGLVGGFAAAHFYSQTDSGKEVFGKLRGYGDELQDAFVSGYKSAEAKLGNLRSEGR